MIGRKGPVIITNGDPYTVKFHGWLLALDYCFSLVSLLLGLKIRVRIGKLISSFLIQNICCGYSKEPSQ